LVDIPFPLVVNAAPPDVANLDRSFARQLALHGRIPIPGSRILKTGSWMVMVNGNWRGTAPAGASVLPLMTICCGWNGALPPNAVSRLIAVRFANMPSPARIEVLEFKP